MLGIRFPHWHIYCLKSTDRRLQGEISDFLEDTAVLVSIIIPVYNVEQYIEKCLDSVLGQTYRELDVICINDGSTDNSLAVLLRYEAQDSRVRIIDKENGGVVSAREAGLRIAKGEYTTFVDADDWIEADAIMEMVAANRVYQADVVACGFWKEQGDASNAIFNGVNRLKR